MKSESTIRPQETAIEQCGDLAEIIFCENISETDRDGTTIYDYDEYRTAVPYRDNLLASVTNNRPAWLEKAQAEEN